MTQLDLTPILCREAKKPPRLPEFYNYLAARGGWVTARQIRSELGLHDRVCRELAEESEGQILSGQEGYKLTRLATPEECDRAAAWLKSQGRKMLRRAIRIQRVHHQRLKPSWITA